MSGGTGDIDASNAHIDTVVQVNVNDNSGVISIPLIPAAGRTAIFIEHNPSRHGTDNLAAASAQQNPAFIGRVKQLNALAALINAADGPAAVAIVAGAGFGKSELAKHFVNTRAKPAAPGASPAALAPDQWTHRWWLDGAKGGEAASLRQHYEAITSQPFPVEPQPTRDADAAPVAAAFRTQLRRAIAAACSTGKHLLVIDNAESPAQIKDYRPANAGRLIATTRRQPIAGAIAHEFPLDITSPEDARTLLAAQRPELQAPCHAKDLDDIAVHLGHHALALAYAAAALARPPIKAPQAILTRMSQADVGDEANILSEFTEEDLGINSKRGLAKSLGLLLDELTEAGSYGHDPLALTLADLMAFCNPAAIPVNLLVAASGKPDSMVEKSLRALHQRSIITLTETAAMHRLTQSLLRGRLKLRGVEETSAVLIVLLAALIELFDNAALHTKHAARTAAMPHAESVIAHACQQASAAGAGAYAAHLRAEVALHLHVTGQLADATRHIDAAIDWYEAQCDEGSLAVCYSSRADIRQDRGDLPGAEADIKKSIDWGEAQSPRDERTLAVCYGSRASIRPHRGDGAGAEADIQKSIDWGEAQSPRDERSLAIHFASRASIRQFRGDLVGAEADIKKSIDWGEAQSSRDKRKLAIDYASRASIRRDVAIKARDAAGFKAARADIDAALTWWLANLPSDERVIDILRETKASIDAAESKK